MRYQAPLRDYHFVLHEVLGAESILAALPSHSDLTMEDVDAVLTEAGRLCADVLLPINRIGDEVGCTLADGRVVTPPGFREAYRTFADGGWIGLCAHPEHGGQGLPRALNFALHEFIMSTNLSFGDYVGLPQAAYQTIDAHASDVLRQRYLPHLASGEWCATMCMTEPHCGTDIGLITTRAVPRPDGAFAISGTKIFISGGDHDLAENIVHLVLARLPDAPPGVKGVSLFLVPKRLPDDAMRPNDLRAAKIERKMGYTASVTCEMLFEGATGWLVGEANRGLRAIFTMVNTARLLTAIQGLGTSEAAYQSAVAYARDRRQGRALAGPRDVNEKADQLLVHPDVRRMLLFARSFNEGARFLAMWTALHIDRSSKSASAEDREESEDFAAFLTPVLKAFFSDIGFESCNACMQVFGGHGYIRDHGMEQLVRDCRIAQIQEGANGVQALDLIGRKLPMHGGRLWGRVRQLIAHFLEASSSVARMEEFAVPLRDALERMTAETEALIHRTASDPDEIGSAGVDYQHAMGLLLFAWAWAQMASVALKHDQSDPFYAAKIHTARFFFGRVLPGLEVRLRVAASGAGLLMNMPDDFF